MARIRDLQTIRRKNGYKIAVFKNDATKRDSTTLII